MTSQITHFNFKLNYVINYLIHCHAFKAKMLYKSLLFIKKFNKLLIKI